MKTTITAFLCRKCFVVNFSVLILVISLAHVEPCHAMYYIGLSYMNNSPRKGVAITCKLHATHTIRESLSFTSNLLERMRMTECKNTIYNF